MVGSGALPRFGHLDLDVNENEPSALGEDSRATYRPFADPLIEIEEPVTSASEASSLGEADLEFDLTPQPPRAPPSTSRIYELSAPVEAAKHASRLPAFSMPPDPFGGLVPVEEEEVDEDEHAAQTFVPAPVLGTPTFVPPRLPPVSGPTPRLSLTDRHSIPRLLTSAKDVAKLPIDHHAGFLLAHVDGVQTLEEILDVCAMPAAKALDLIARLKAMGAIEFE